MNPIIALIALETAGQAPEWVRLLPLGEVTLGDGREGFTVDEAALAAIAAGFRERGLDLVVDYEHQSLSGEKAPAAGWIKELEARGDGLWMRVEWTETARRHITSKEYRYFSPVLRIEPETRRPVRLLHGALTNTPAMNDLLPLAAKLAILRPAAACAAGYSFQEENVMKKQLMELLGITGEQPDEEILSLADARLKLAGALQEIGEILGLPAAEATTAKIKGAILALKQGQDALARVQTELAGLKSDLAARDAQALVDEALKAGKVTPAQKDWALKYAREDAEGFKTFVAQAPKVVPVNEGLKSTGTGGNKGAGGLSENEQIICTQLLIKPEEFLAAKAG